MEFKRYAGEDGRRIEESVREVVSADAVERIHEVHEEVVPMKLTKKITTKVVSVPVEEKTEVFSADGSVQTSIKSVASDAFSLDKRECAEPVAASADPNLVAAFHHFAQELQNLKANLNRKAVEPVVVEPVVEPVVAPPVVVEPVVVAQPKVDPTVVVEPVVVEPVVVVDKTVVEEKRPFSETIIAGGAWAAAAIVAAYLVYQLI